MASPSPPPYRGTNTYGKDGNYIADIQQTLVEKPKNKTEATVLDELLKKIRNEEGRFYDTDEFNNLVVKAKQQMRLPVLSLGGKSKRSKSKRSKSKRSKSKRSKSKRSKSKRSKSKRTKRK
jgi:hypothetical protein